MLLPSSANAVAASEFEPPITFAHKKLPLVSYFATKPSLVLTADVKLDTPTPGSKSTVFANWPQTKIFPLLSIAIEFAWSAPVPPNFNDQR